MLPKLQKKIEIELREFISDIRNSYKIGIISETLFEHIKEFMLRPGKRLRPMLFLLGYLGYTKKEKAGLYRSALAIELLHDFMLVHDDIIDKSELRRGKPAMHTLFKKVCAKKAKFGPQDLAIVTGDVMYALAIHAFLTIKEEPQRKELALKKFIEAGIYTGTGEFIELMLTLKPLEKIVKKDIYSIYDYKTAQYTFSCPLSTGAILAGAGSREIDSLFKLGIYLGRGFQIKDDILGMFSKEADIGKSALTDLKESKKTLLVWQAFNKADKTSKRRIKRILSKKEAGLYDLKVMRSIIVQSRALKFALSEISNLAKKADKIISGLAMKPGHKKVLSAYSNTILFPPGDLL